MATTTPIFGWPVPTSTDYVKDGATAIEALGDAIDATVAGGVLQIVSTTKTDTFSTTSTSFTDITGVSLSITPKSINSKILLIVSLMSSGSGAGSEQSYQLVRGSTAIGIGVGGTTVNATAGAATSDLNSISMTFRDSPATTSATTYKIQGRIAGGGTLYVNRRSADDYFRFSTTITAIEVGS